MEGVTDWDDVVLDAEVVVAWVPDSEYVREQAAFAQMVSEAINRAFLDDAPAWLVRLDRAS